MTAARPRLAAPVVRPVRAGDVPGVVALQVAAWRAAYAGIIPTGYLRAMSAAERESRHLERLRNPAPGSVYLLAERGDELAGMAAAGPVRDSDLDPQRIGEVYAMYAAPAAWSTGVGTALMTACVTSLRDSGFERATLWVLERNRRGRAFYERCGWWPEGATQVLDLGGPVREVRYGTDL